MVLTESNSLLDLRRDGALSSLPFRHIPGPLGLWRVGSPGKSLLQNCEQVPGLLDI